MQLSKSVHGRTVLTKRGVNVISTGVVLVREAVEKFSVLIIREVLDVVTKTLDRWRIAFALHARSALPKQSQTSFGVLASSSVLLF